MVDPEPVSERPPIRPEDVPGGSAAGAERAHHGGGPYMDGSKLVQQVAARQQQGTLPASNQPLMHCKCERCGHPFTTKRVFGLAYCIADDPPFVGEGRGCGWMLFTIPTRDPENGDTLALVDCQVNAETGLGSRKQQSAGFLMYAEQLNRRGLVKKAFDLEQGKMGRQIKTPAEVGL